MLAALPGCTLRHATVDEYTAEKYFEHGVERLGPGVRSLHERVPYVSPRAENSCGVTCLDMVLRYEDRELPPDVAAALQETTARDQEVTLGDLKHALESVGFLAIHLQGAIDWPEAAPGVEPQRVDWKNPLTHVDRGRPPILRVRSPHGQYHFVVLVGHHPPSRTVFVYNPGFGPGIWTTDMLETWRKAGSWFVAYKPPATGGS